MRLGGRFGVLRVRNLRFVFAATTVSEFGDGVVGVALAFAVLDLTGSATDLGIVFAVKTIAQVSALLVGGVVSDRVSRRAVMMGADITRCVSQLAIGALLVSKHASVAEIVASQAVLGAASGFFNPASAGLIPAVAEDHLQEANALQGMVAAASGMIGPALGAVIVVGVGAPWAMVVDGASYLGSALFLSRVSGSVIGAIARDEGSTFFSDLRDGFHEVASRTWVWSLILAFAVINSAAGAFGVLGPLICKRHYGGAPAFALLGICFSAGVLLAGSLMLRFKPRHPLRAGVLMCVPLGFANVLLALHAPLYVVAPFSVIAGMGPIGFNTLWWTTLQQEVPPELISRVISYDFAGSFALQPIGYALAGPLAVAIGLSPALIAFGAVTGVLSAATLLVRDVRTLERGSARAAPASP